MLFDVGIKDKQGEPVSVSSLSDAARNAIRSDLEEQLRQAHDGIMVRYAAGRMTVDGPSGVETTQLYPISDTLGVFQDEDEVYTATLTTRVSGARRRKTRRGSRRTRRRYSRRVK